MIFGTELVADGSKFTVASQPCPSRKEYRDHYNGRRCVKGGIM